jgi:AraC-like DNA-binding protein
MTSEVLRLRSEAEASSASPIARIITRVLTHIDRIGAGDEIAWDFAVYASALLRTEQRTPATAEKWESSERSERRARSSRTAALAPWQIRAVLSYIDAHIGEFIAVGELARRVRLSCGHFHRTFKETVGVCPGEFIVRRRIEHACRMMRESRESLAQVAQATGMSDHSHFCRVFRRLMGESPSAWRRARFDEAVLALECDGAAHLMPSGAHPGRVVHAPLAVGRQAA